MQRRRMLGAGIVTIFLFACGGPITTELGRRIRSEATAPSTLALLQGLPETVFLPVPLVRQSRNFTCGAAALQSLLAFYGDSFREGQLQRLLGTEKKNGTSFRPMKILIESVLNVADAKDKALSYPACEEDTNKTSPEFQKDCVEG